MNTSQMLVTTKVRTAKPLILQGDVTHASDNIVECDIEISVSRLSQRYKQRLNLITDVLSSLLVWFTYKLEEIYLGVVIYFHTLALLLTRLYASKRSSICQ